MTKREFYVALTETEALSAEMREYAAHLLESFDASAEKRKEAADLRDREYHEKRMEAYK